MAGVRLTGYSYSVYSWIARLTLHEKGVPYQWREVDPFDRPLSEEFLAVSPFGTVPVLDHDDFSLTETRAIARYIDEAFDGPSLSPAEPQQKARASQMISIMDCHGYWPMVRQVFSHDVFRRSMGDYVSEEKIRDGLEKSDHVLTTLEDLVYGDTFLTGEAISLADLHLFPHVEYLSRAGEGMTLIRQKPKLSRWFDTMNSRTAVSETRPMLNEKSPITE